mmetsp:Transcript_31139/g.66305  ORF Transcript_31139/g.66305 Transcript_31139/m.66305 type:complete len:285 (-) Transcript_31139:272-1126(-)
MVSTLVRLLGSPGLLKESFHLWVRVVVLLLTSGHVTVDPWRGAPGVGGGRVSGGVALPDLPPLRKPATVFLQDLRLVQRRPQAVDEGGRASRGLVEGPADPHGPPDHAPDPLFHPGVGFCLDELALEPFPPAHFLDNVAPRSTLRPEARLLPPLFLGPFLPLGLPSLPCPLILVVVARRPLAATVVTSLPFPLVGLPPPEIERREVPLLALPFVQNLERRRELLEGRRGLRDTTGTGPLMTVGMDPSREGKELPADRRRRVASRGEEETGVAVDLWIDGVREEG